MSWQDYASAPPLGTLVCARGEVTGTLTLLVESARGRFPMLLVETSAGLRAYVNACPHQYLPLDYRSASLLSADGTALMCSAHGAMFDAETGEGTGGEGLGCALDRVPVVERQGQIIIGDAS